MFVRMMQTLSAIIDCICTVRIYVIITSFYEQIKMLFAVGNMYIITDEDRD